MKKRRVIMAIGILCFLFIGNLFYKNYIRVQNIFDQMYYTRIRTHYDWWEGGLGGLGNKVTSFQKMPQIEPISRDSESCNTEYGQFPNVYKEKYLRKGEILVIVCSRNEKKMEIIGTKLFDDCEIVFNYTYNIRTRQLQESIECGYGKLTSEESNGFLGNYQSYTDDFQKVLSIINKMDMTEKDLVQYKKYFLYDKFITDWLAVNNSRFSIDRWGYGQFIEELPPISTLSDSN